MQGMIATFELTDFTIMLIGGPSAAVRWRATVHHNGTGCSSGFFNQKLTKGRAYHDGAAVFSGERQPACWETPAHALEGPCGSLPRCRKRAGQRALRDLLKFGFAPARDNEAYHDGADCSGGEAKHGQLRDMLQSVPKIIGGPP